MSCKPLKIKEERKQVPCQEGFPTFTVELPSSFAELKAWINSNLRRAKGLRFYSEKISTKERKKLVRKRCLQEKKNMFKRKRQSFI